MSNIIKRHKFLKLMRMSIIMEGVSIYMKEISNKKEKKILDFAGNFKYLTYLGCFLSGISSILVLVPFICIYKIAYEILKVLPKIEQASNIEQYGWYAVLFSILGIIVYFAALMCTHLAAFRTAKNMRSEDIHHMVKLPLGYFDKNGSGKIRRVIDESSASTETLLAHMLPDLAGAIVTPIAMLVLLFTFDWRLGLLSLVPMILGFFSMRKMMGKEIEESMRQYENALEEMNNEAVEYIRGIPVVKTFNQTVFSFENFHKSIMKYKNWAVNFTITMRPPMCKFTVAINSIFALLIPAGILLIGTAVNPQKFLSDFIFYIIFTPIITIVMNKIMFSSEDLMMARDGARRINAILQEKPLEECEFTNIVRKSDIKFNHVTFTYPGSDRKALDDISLEIKQGSTVALLGPSGGGKTTIASLIPRFFDVDSGEITIGGINVKNISNEDLMNHVSFVFQNTNLFKTSLYENIKFSKQDATKEEVINAAKAAQCEEIFDKMPDGINTVVGSSGVYLSGGEAQRIALARAILKEAPIVLLDEATAFADPENEHKIQKAFEVLTKNKTVLMIAHRLSTVKNADKIIVIEDGQIKESGTHEELLSKNNLYAKMWEDYKKSISWKVKDNKNIKNKLKSNLREESKVM